MPQDKPQSITRYSPSPVVMCPISGDPIRLWSLVGDNPGADIDNATVVKEQDEVDFETDFRITANSSSPLHEKLSITAHCFVKDGKWAHTEVCKVVDEISGVIIYDTDAPSPEDRLRELMEKKKG